MIPNFTLHTATRLGINILLLLVAVIGLRLGETIVIPLLIALILACVLGPAATWLHCTLRIRWSLACFVVIIGLVAINCGLIAVATVSVARLAQSIPHPDDKEEVKRVYMNIHTKISSVWPWDLDEDIFPPPARVEKADDWRLFKDVRDAVPSLLASVARRGGEWIFTFVIMMFTLLFLLMEGRMLTRRIVEIFGPSDEIKSRVALVLTEMAKQVRTYLVWRTIINFGLALLMGFIYQLAGCKQAWTWAIALAILNYIPYLGPLIAWPFPVIDAFFTNSAAAAVVVHILYWTIIVMEGYLVVPLLMGRNMDMNATTVMLACLFWELLWGMTGLFLAMPIMAGVKAILYHVPEWRPWANLMAADHDEVQATEVPDPGTGDANAERNGTLDGRKPHPGLH